MNWSDITMSIMTFGLQSGSEKIQFYLTITIMIIAVVMTLFIIIIISMVIVEMETAK